MDIHNRIRLLRVEKGYTQVQIAEKLDIPRMSYIAIEKGTRKIDAALLCKLADIYYVSVDYILCRTEVEKPQYIVNRLVGNMINEAQHNIYIMMLFKMLENASNETINKVVQILKIFDDS